jgi:hypothetical protein
MVATLMPLTFAEFVVGCHAFIQRGGGRREVLEVDDIEADIIHLTLYRRYDLAAEELRT